MRTPATKGSFPSKLTEAVKKNNLFQAADSKWPTAIRPITLQLSARQLNAELKILAESKQGKWEKRCDTAKKGTNSWCLEGEPSQASAQPRRNTTADGKKEANF